MAKKEYKTKFNFDFKDGDLKKRFKNHATNNETSLQEMIEKALVKTYPKLYN